MKKSKTPTKTNSQKSPRLDTSKRNGVSELSSHSDSYDKTSIKEDENKIIKIKVGRNTYTFNLFYDEQLKGYIYALYGWELIELIKIFSSEKIKILKDETKEKKR